MVIAVNTRFLLNEDDDGYRYFLYEVLQRIVNTYPHHRFIFIYDRHPGRRFFTGKNAEEVIAGPAARHPLLWKLWYDVRIPAAIKKYNADVFVSCDGICSLSLKVSQCLLIPGPSFLYSFPFSKKSHNLFYKRNTPKCLEKAGSIVTFSSLTKAGITQQYKIDPGKITVVPAAIKEVFRSLIDEEKLKTKDKFTGGKEYFIHPDPYHPRKNLTNLLKAFSVFKKRQASNWKLVLTGKFGSKGKDFISSLATYKYRDDVILTGDLSDEDLAGILGSAYALVYPSLWENFAAPVYEALYSGVPVITSANSVMQSIAGDAALYCDPAHHTDIADKMMLIYKDESLRAKLIGKGKELSRQYDWDKSVAILWQSIIKATD